MFRIRSRLTIGALSLAFLLLATAPFALAVTQSDLTTHQQKADNARKQAAAAEARAADLLAEAKRLETVITGTEKKVQAIQSEVGTARLRRAKLDREVDILRAKISAKQSEISDTKADLERQNAVLDKRADATYRQGDLFFVEILLGSQDIQDFITRTTLVKSLIVNDRAIADEIGATRDSLEDAQTELNRSLQAVSITRAEARAQESLLKKLYSQRSGVLYEQRSAQDQKESLFAENKANAARLRAVAQEEERESERIAAELRKRSSNGGGVYNGVMAWPVPSSTRITSPFGYRVHPILGTRKLHTGLDIGAPSGSTIVAAGPGTVIYAGYRGGYGNTTMIDHGDGVVSLYGHQSSIGVSTGAHVSRGQSIGRVGSTGMSTGPHLHFEVRVNGTPKNPMIYLR